MRILLALLVTVPNVVLAHTGHPVGSGHDLWVIGAVFAIAAIYGLTRKA
jgi:hypothetical protein